MCFSSPVSFGAAAALGVIGILTLKKVKSKNDFLLACFPLIFATQQLIEGITWLYLGNQETAPACLNYLFLLYADVLWPLLVPLSVYLIEPHGLRKKIMFPLVAFGIGCSAYFLWHLINGNVSSSVQGQHILYRLYGVEMYKHMKIIYLFIVSFPFLLSSYKWIFIFGLSILGSFYVTDYFAKEAFISVWCFFAALLSSIVYMHFRTTHISKPYSS